MNLVNLHYKLLNMGFRVHSAPDEATIYVDAEGTTLLVDEPSQKEISRVLKKSNTHPVTGDLTPQEMEIILRERIIARDAR